MGRGFIMTDISGSELTSADRDLLLEENVGGVILFSRNYESPQQISKLVQEIRNLKSPPLLVAVDHEGGRVQRFRNGFTDIPAMRKIGRLYEINANVALKVSETVGWIIGAELRSVGIDLSFAPCVDLDWGVSSVIGDRSFHKNKYAVENLAYHFSKGMRESGMSPVAKHFPGHGAVAIDSHEDLPVDRREFSKLLDDIYPYESLIRKNIVPAVMMAHIIYKEADNLPASISEYWMQNHLRNQLNFNGVIFSDDLSMHALRDYGNTVTRAEKALRSGCDMILICNDRDNTKKVIQAKKNHRNYNSMIRIARVSGKKTYSLGELQNDQKWRSARALIEKFVINPENLL
tara:strand:- start:250 stop:1290 length:1041 start_codon:yes stop_codon:yes gene_type:complete